MVARGARFVAERIDGLNHQNLTRRVPTNATRLSGFDVSDTEFIRWFWVRRLNSQTRGERIDGLNHQNLTRPVPTNATRLSGFDVSDTEFIRWGIRCANAVRPTPPMNEFTV